MSTILVAKQTFVADMNGSDVAIMAGQRVRKGHPVTEAHPEYFEPAGSSVDFEWETATAAPGEKRAVGRPRKAKADEPKAEDDESEES